MWFSYLRKRLPGGDADIENHETSGLNDLNEPLLKCRNYDDKHSEGHRSKEITDEERRKVDLQWESLFSNSITQWTNWMANIVQGSGTSIVQLFRVHFNIQHGQNQKVAAPVLSLLQKERLKRLQKRLEVPFDGSQLEHQDALWQLWRLAYPNRELPSLKSELWGDMGWQGTDPSTDFRGGGFISLENLIFFAKNYPESFQSLLHKKDGNRADWEYPFAVAGINISFMLVQMLNLRSGKPSSLAGIRFLQLLGEDETAFDNLFCVAFQMMDAQWLIKRASYLDFNDVLKSTRKQLKRELELDGVASVKDLPAFNMLRSREGRAREAKMLTT
ncbi:ELMO domain-containing protein A-like [Hibiscus syriacus]|uniref:ELMO domain-containing protein A-like n=1 Tax=Hibiscus syriacus TaxID=106335 RepID=UPI0019210228|nr:ELMO domain-containing protein A-like [Hibiscus syriacus]